jgi:LysM repeat protein
MPVATIGLFALAIVVIVLAFAIEQMVGDGGGDSQAPADAVATRDALNRTRTAQAGGGDTTPTTPTTPTTQTPGNQTGTPPNGGQTPTTRTPSPGATSGTGTTYVVQDGDSCFAIAEANDVTLQELLDANDLTEDDCTRLNVGDELIIP